MRDLEHNISFENLCPRMLPFASHRHKAAMLCVHAEGADRRVKPILFYIRNPNRPHSTPTELAGIQAADGQ
jgi:hypothetical protein